MSAVGEISDLEVNGEIVFVKAMTAHLGVYKSAHNGRWFAVDNDGRNRAAFETLHLARQWCLDAAKDNRTLPESTSQIMGFNERMKARGWSVVQLLGDCQVWDICHSPETLGARILGEAANQEKALVRDDLARPSQSGGKA